MKGIFAYISPSHTHTTSEVNRMDKSIDKKKQEKQNRQKNHDKYNSITQKTEPENQNSGHNVREEGIHPINQKR
ncbi:hypothetical protein EDD76_102106 [Kineothrix alysoides]|jgi:hypothetical protein|uniref:Uncharacterized protein n=1 Tax=Kineothrix alysoides TaxID=1469948 RepID=A0A4R1R4S5_9FIRM|nr:hypothetical protein [Kineothrix alysoides]TCL60410.1 hypothetical protein EDD76_102106 [Kineothrix alysoides]